MEEVVGVDMLQPCEDLKKDALHAGTIQPFMISSFHQLIQISVHILHTDMKLSANRVEEDIKRRNKVRMCGKRTQKYDLSKLQTWFDGIESLFHCFNGNLHRRLAHSATTSMGLRTIVPRRAMWAPAVRTRANATLPKLPSPMSLIISNLSSRQVEDIGPCDDIRRGNSIVTVISTEVSGILDMDLSVMLAHVSVARTVSYRCVEGVVIIDKVARNCCLLRKCETLADHVALDNHSS